MIPLIIFIALGVLIVIAYEIRARKQGKTKQEQQAEVKANKQANLYGECCGEHLICEKETLLQTDAKIEYYDDEELDTMAGIDPKEYTEEQIKAIRDVFESINDTDITGWVRSLQLRNIALPEDIREEALLIIIEKRKKNKR